MTTADIYELVSTYSPDHCPSISAKSLNNNTLEHAFKFGNYSIIKFKPAFYNGNYEAYNPEVMGDIYRNPTLAGIIDYIISIDPAILYSPISHPEYFL